MRLLATLLSLALSSVCSAEIPDVFIDRGACPGEGCKYCEIYSAGAELTLYDKPSTESNAIGRLLVGEIFLAQTGEVHTVPTRFEVREASGPFRPGDEVFALTYGGEGWFRVFHNGMLIDASLGFSPWGGGAGKTCDKPEFCFGQLTKELEFYWWMYVLSESGEQGWVIHDRSMRWIEPKYE